MSIFSNYDVWKTCGPDDDGRTCETCGGWLREPICGGGWYCNQCEEESQDEAHT